MDGLRDAFTSREAFVRFVEAPPPVGEEQLVDARKHRVSHPVCHVTYWQWTNLDLAPSPPQDRKWTRWTFFAFWMAHAANASNWTAGSSLISLGLYPLDTWLCLASSHVFVTFLIVSLPIQFDI